MQFGEYLRDLRESRQPPVSKTELARRIGLRSANYFVDIEAGRAKPPTPARCEQIADVLEATPAERAKLKELATIERASEETRTIVESHFVAERGGAYKSGHEKTRKLYLLGSVPAGKIEPSADYVEGMITVDYSLIGNKDCFALRVSGNCLEDKGITDGDIVIVAKVSELSNGDIAVVRIHDHDDGQVTMKIWRQSDGEVVLMPASRQADQSPIIIRKDDKKQVEIVGKVIAAIKDFRTRRAP